MPMYKPPRFFHDVVKTNYLDIHTGISMSHQGLIPINLFFELEKVRDDLDDTLWHERNVKNVTSLSQLAKKPTAQGTVRLEVVKPSQDFSRNLRQSLINTYEKETQTGVATDSASHVKVQNTSPNVTQDTSGQSDTQTSDSTNKTSTSNASTVTNISGAMALATLKVSGASMVMAFLMILMVCVEWILSGLENGYEKVLGTIKRS